MPDKLINIFFELFTNGRYTQNTHIHTKDIRVSRWKLNFFKSEIYYALILFGQLFG